MFNNNILYGEVMSCKQYLSHHMRGSRIFRQGCGPDFLIINVFRRGGGGVWTSLEKQSGPIASKIHLNHGGIRKFFQNIEKHCKVMGPTVSSRAESPIHRRRSMSVAGTGYHFSSRYCHICSMRNHSTHDCWFNVRHSGISHRSVH